MNNIELAQIMTQEYYATCLRFHYLPPTFFYNILDSITPTVRCEFNYSYSSTVSILFCYSC